jgi:hypothetical protein
MYNGEMLTLVAFRKPLIWLQAAFRNSFVMAPPALGTIQINQIKKLFPNKLA